MVFCGWADGAPNTPALMEFPHVCEIKVNGRVLEAVSTALTIIASLRFHRKLLST